MNEPMKRTIAHWWALHQGAVLQEMPEKMREAMQMSFYAGAEAMLMMWEDIISSNMSEQASFAIVKSWREEGVEFGRALARRSGMPEPAVADLFGRGAKTKRTPM